MNENFDRDNHLPEQFSPLLLVNVTLPPKSPNESLAFPNNIKWGEGDRKRFWDLVSVSIQGNGEIRALIEFVSTSSEQRLYIILK